MGTVVRGQARARRAAGRATADWRSGLARVGLVAKGVFHVSLGLLAVGFARGRNSSEEASPQGAVEQIAQQPAGRWLVLALAVGLVCLTLWHLVQAVTGDPVEGDEAADRAKYAGKVVSYGAITALTAGILAQVWGRGGGSPGQGGQSEEQATATVLGWPGGPWLVGAAGLALIAIGAYALYRYALQAEFLRRLDHAEMGSLRSPVEAAGRVGYAARGIVFGIVGALLVVAAVRHDPSEAGGLSDALQALAGEAWGRLLLWVVAAGFVLYGLFSLAEARYRRAT